MGSWTEEEPQCCLGLQDRDPAPHTSSDTHHSLFLCCSQSGPGSSREEENLSPDLLVATGPSEVPFVKKPFCFQKLADSTGVAELLNKWIKQVT